MKAIVTGEIEQPRNLLSLLLLLSRNSSLIIIVVVIDVISTPPSFFWVDGWSKQQKMYNIQSG